MQLRFLPRRTAPALIAATCALCFAALAQPAHAQDDSAPKDNGRHLRKYKPPPQTSDIEVTVLKGFDKKPVINAAVVFHPVDADGKDEGFLEMKTDPDGKAKIDVIPTGSNVRIQVIATGFATYGGDYKVDEAEQKITINMQRPHAQISTYVDETGKPAMIKPGVQEPVRPKLDKNGDPIDNPAPANANTGKAGAQNSSATGPPTK